MKYEELFNLFGHSEFSPEVKAILPKLHIPSTRPEKSVCWRSFQSDKWNLSLTFIGKNNYKHDIGLVKSEFITDYDESVLEEINFGGTGSGVNYPHTLPYDLAFGDSLESVIKKIPVKHSESSENSKGTYLLFNFEELRLQTAFDHNQKLIWLRVKPLEKSFKRKRELAKSLKEQKKNLVSSGIKDLLTLKDRSPIIAWKKRMGEGDDQFTTKNIDETNILLNAFIDNLVEATEQKKANAIYQAVKKLTRAINTLNDKHESFIDTLEREELVEYIHKAVRLTGFKIEKDLDLTEEWREW